MRAKAWRAGLLACGLGAAVAAMALVSGCNSHRVITVSMVTETIELEDGSRLIKHTLGPYPEALERGFRPWAQVAYVQDATPRPVLTITPRMAEVIAMNMLASLVEHRGVTPDGAVNEMAFWIGSAHRTRVDDHLTAMYDDLPRLPESRPLIVIGEGEGGHVAAAMANIEPRITHLILLNTGGGWTGVQEMRHWLDVHGEVAGLRSVAELEEAAEAIRTDPDSLEMLGPRAYTALAGRLDRTILDELGPRRLPILLVHAVEDERIPVQSARAMKDLAAEQGLDMTYVEIEDADHLFRDVETGRSRYNQVEVAIADWLAQEELIAARTARRLRKRLESSDD